MSLDPVTSASSPAAAPVPPPAPVRAAAEERRDPAPPADERPPTPGEKLREAVAYLRATDRELHFSMKGGRTQIEVYDGDGRLVQRIPPTEALARATVKGTAWLA